MREKGAAQVRGNPKAKEPRHCAAAQIRNHIPWYAVPKAICVLGATGAEHLEDKREGGRTGAGPCAVHRSPAHRTVNASGGPTT